MNPNADSRSEPSREELIALVAAQAAEIAALKARIAELERRLGLNSSNSGKPPSSDGLKKAPRVTSLREPSDKPKGHKGETLRQVAEPDRIVNLPQGLAFMTFWLVRRFAQARHPRRLLEPVTRRRLAAVGTVQSQPSLKFGDTHFQGRDLGRLRLDQCNQFSPRWLAWRLRIHESLNRNEIPLSRKISGRP